MDSTDSTSSDERVGPNPIKVLHIVAAPMAHPGGKIGVNGPERRAANIIRQWRRHGIVPVTAYPQRGRLWAAFADSGAGLIDWEIGSKWALHRAFGLAAMVRRQRARLIHTQGPASLDLIAGLAARLAGVPFIVTRPVMIEDMKTYEPWRLRVYGLIDRIGLSLASVVVAISEHGRRRLVASNPAVGSKIRLVRNGIALEHFLAVARDRSPRESFMVGMAAQLTGQKAWPDFIAVIKELRRRGLPVQGLIVGDGPLRGELEMLVCTSGLEGVVEFAGFQADVAPALARMDVFLFTSRWEGLSVAVIEAMAAGLPVVATEVAAIREQVIEGSNGAVRPFGDVSGLADACEALWRDPTARMRQGAASAARAEQLFSERRMVAEYAAVYRAVS